jgi:hypothetical protein
MEKRYQNAIKEIDELLSNTTETKKESKKPVKADVKKSKNKKSKKNTKKSKLKIRQPNIRSRIIGILFFIAGVITLVAPYPLNTTSIVNSILANTDSLNIKISIGLFLIGIFSIFLIREKSTKDLVTTDRNNKTKKINLLMSEKITIVLSLWVVLLIFITYVTSLEVFFILIFIGTLVTKELTDYYTSYNLKFRLNIFVVVFLIIFTAIISQKIINIL